MDGSRKRKHFLAAVKWNRILKRRSVPQRYTADREIVLAAVQQNGSALEYAAEECKTDRKIVLAAVTQNGYALQWAAEECKTDRQIVLAAVTQN
eukprot:1273511-Amphidinium_carterae.1